MSDAPSGKLKEQDLTNLDVTKLTPSSPQVISRQATINIGTIGHVAHGKSTIVKAVSGVQTVRFKNELERNITIKLESVKQISQSTSSAKTSKHRQMSEFNNDRSKISKVYISSEQNLDMIDAALLNCEISLKKNDSAVDSTKLLNTKKLIPKKNTSSGYEKVSVASKSPNLKLNTKSNDNHLPSKVKKLEFPNVDQSSQVIPDNAFISIPSVAKGAYKSLISNSMIKSYIFEGKMIDVLSDNIDEAYDSKEIDEIVDDAVIHGVHFYLVKWKNWSRGFNTWEKFNTLYNSQLLIFKYLREKQKNNSMIVNDLCKSVNGLRVILSRRIVSKIFDLFRNETGLCLPIVNIDDIVNLLHNIDNYSKKIGCNRKKTLSMNLAVIALGHYRQKQLEELQNYEVEINVLSNNGYSITVENNVDLEGPPDVFTYSERCVLTGVTKLDDPPIGCSCKNNCQQSDFCCYDMAGYPVAYNANKNVIVPPGHPIFECNKKCKCTNKCSNRVVQLGSKVKVCIYKTRSPCRWGVKTKQDIVKGQFVSEYVGEIITIEQAEERLENKYSSMDNMWNLDFNDADDYKYIIDSSHYANYTYFINHSCNANLNVYAVWVNCLDLNLPHLALFANRDITSGEPLTVNYFSRCGTESLKKTGIKCQCNMKNCKGYFF